MEKEPTNRKLQPTKPIQDSFRPNDIAFRLVLIPFFGITIPLLTGMIHPGNFGHWEIKLSFLYTIAIAFLVWHGNRYLHFSLRSYFDWYNKPIRKIAVLLMTIIFYTVPISVLLLVGWYKIFDQGNVNWNVVFTSTLIIMICVVFITHVYETVFLVKESESEIVRNEQLERAKAEAELEALKNQIDPHFIFNSLNTLSHLIEARPLKAKQFNDNLADVYRYILQNKRRDLVLLREEMEFLHKYFSLLTIRFESAVQMRVSINEALFDQYLVPPISLQILVENAIKHNEFSDSSPVEIDIHMENDMLIIHNKIRKRKFGKVSSGIGLINLIERCKLTTGKQVIVEENDKDFTVRLPVLLME